MCSFACVGSIVDIMCKPGGRESYRAVLISTVNGALSKPCSARRNHTHLSVIPPTKARKLLGPDKAKAGHRH